MEDASNVVKITTTKDGATVEEKVVPVNFTMTLAISQHRHVQATTSFFPVPGSSPDKTLDEMARSLERQRNKVQVTEIDEEIANRRKAIGKMVKKIAELDQEHEAKVEALKGKKIEARTEYTNAYNAEKEATEKSGNRTFDDTKPGVKGKLGPKIKAISEIDLQIEALEAERTKGHTEFLKNVKDFEDAIAEKEEEKTALIKLIGD